MLPDALALLPGLEVRTCRYNHDAAEALIDGDRLVMRCRECDQEVSVPWRMAPNCHSEAMARRVLARHLRELVRLWNLWALRPVGYWVGRGTLAEAAGVAPLPPLRPMPGLRVSLKTSGAERPAEAPPEPPRELPGL
uniref:Uncharacterized protein n=1 Tax=viral metagenome TaxID=1070528 RepID=A0A6M3J3U8_9ZZZZ